MERSEILQPPLPLKRQFDSRETLTAFLRAEFPALSAIDDNVSPIPGGARAAEALLQSIEPRRYAATRNFLTGAVTRLSPHIRHGVLTLERVRQHAQNVPKLISELAWRDYWQRLYYRWGAEVWADREPYKTGWQPEDYSEQLPSDLGSTGLACMDAFAAELHATGYLHNHARMWMAAYVVHWRRVKWQAGARWFLTHLLDGDPASNNLSWQWVASTFSHKPYFFNRENLEKYTAGQYCRVCARHDDCPFEDSYEALSARLFQIGDGQ